MTQVLELDNISVSYDDVRALREVSFTVEPGTVTGLIGPNGAGKTTLLDVISGFVHATAGAVTLDGRPIDGLSPHRRARVGISRTFQSVDLFDDMTVAENLAVAAEVKMAATDLRRAAQLVGIDDADHRLAGALSLGERKRVALARALTSAPKLLLLDEPAAGLDHDERAALSTRLRDIAASGTAVLLVDHDLSLVLDACDRVVVLDFGRVIAAGPPKAVRNDPAVVSAYVGTVGTTAAASAAEPTTTAQQQALSVRGLAAGYGGSPVVADVDLQVGSGEIVALLGPNGAGKTTTLLALSGALPRIRGEVEVLGHPTRSGAHRQAAAGVAHVVQGRGVFTGLTTRENLRLVDRSGDATAEVLDLLPALKPRLHAPAGRLSGGEQQMLALARALAARPRLLIIDELSLGLSPKVVAELLGTLAARARESGMAVLLAEQHAAIALTVAARVYVLAAGRVVDSGPADAFSSDPQRLSSAYLGPS